GGWSLAFPFLLLAFLLAGGGLGPVFLVPAVHHFEVACALHQADARLLVRLLWVRREGVRRRGVGRHGRPVRPGVISKAGACVGQRAEASEVPAWVVGLLSQDRGSLLVGPVPKKGPCAAWAAQQ